MNVYEAVSLTLGVIRTLFGYKRIQEKRQPAADTQPPDDARITVPRPEGVFMKASAVTESEFQELKDTKAAEWLTGSRKPDYALRIFNRSGAVLNEPSWTLTFREGIDIKLRPAQPRENQVVFCKEHKSYAYTYHRQLVPNREGIATFIWLSHETKTPFTLHWQITTRDGIHFPSSAGDYGTVEVPALPAHS